VNAIEFLEKQHRAVDELFRRFDKASDPEEKERVFEKIADALAIHTTIEEKHFYPATRSARTEELLREAVEEHLQAKRMIADLLDLPPESEQFDAKVAVLREEIQHHVASEEQVLFPRVQQIFSDDELEDLAAVMEDLAEELEEEGSPRAHVPAETDESARI
jgi:hemerythrin superfamily protein